MSQDLRTRPAARPPARQDPLQLAFRAGYTARLAGQPLADCPHGERLAPLRLAWVRGWLDRLATEPARARA